MQSVPTSILWFFSYGWLNRIYQSLWESEFFNKGILFLYYRSACPIWNTFWAFFKWVIARDYLNKHFFHVRSLSWFWLILKSAGMDVTKNYVVSVVPWSMAEQTRLKKNWYVAIAAPWQISNTCWIDSIYFTGDGMRSYERECSLRSIM